MKAHKIKDTCLAIVLAALAVNATSALADSAVPQVDGDREAKHSLEALQQTALAWGESEINDGKIAVQEWPADPSAFYMGALLTWHGPEDPVGKTLIDATGPGVSLQVRVASVPAGKAAAAQSATEGLVVSVDPRHLEADRTNAVFLTWDRNRFVTLYINGELIDFWPVKGAMPKGGASVVKTSAPLRDPAAIRWFCMGPGLPTFAQRHRLHELWQTRSEVSLEVYPVHQPYGVVLQDPKATLRDPSEAILVDGRWHVYFTRVTGTHHGFTGSVWGSSCAVTDDPFDPASWSKPVEMIPKGKAGVDPDGTGCFTPDCFYDGEQVALFYTALDSTAPNGYPSLKDPFCPEHILVAHSKRGDGPFVKTPKHSPHTATERRLGYDEATIPGGHMEFEGQPLFDISLIDHGQCWVMPDGERRYYYKGGGTEGGAICVMRDFDKDWLNGRRISADPLLWVGQHMENILITRVDDTIWLQHMIRRINPLTGKRYWEWLHSWTSPADDGLKWRYIGGGLPHVGSRHSYSHGVAHTVNPEWGIGQMPVGGGRIGLVAMKVL